MYRVSEREINKLKNLSDKLKIVHSPLEKALLEDAERDIWHRGKTGKVQKNLYRQYRLCFNLQQVLELLKSSKSNEFSLDPANKSLTSVNNVEEHKPLKTNNFLDNTSTLLLGIPTYSEIEGYSTSNDLKFGLHNFTGSEIIEHSGEGHLITVAPTGTGKRTTAIIPNLLHYEGSVIESILKAKIMPLLLVIVGK